MVKLDRIAEDLADWFGSTTFIAFNAIWFASWIIAHFTLGFDPDWSILTLIVSLEAIFLSLFILRAETIQARRFEHKVDADIKTSDQILSGIETLKRQHRSKKSPAKSK